MRKMALVGGLVFFSVLVAAGCGGEGDPAVAEESNVTETATISFDADFSHNVEGRLVEGGQALVKYDADRMPEECTSSTLNSGQPAWTVTGYYSFNGGDFSTFEAGGFSTTGGARKPIIKLEESGTLEIYFHVHDRWGTCGGDEEHYDSNFGKNYVFEVAERGSSTTVTVGGGEEEGTTVTTTGGGEGGYGGDYGTTGSVGGSDYGTTGSVGGSDYGTTGGVGGG